VARPRFPLRRSQDLAWLITGPLFVVAALLTLPITIGRPDPFGHLPLGLCFLGLFLFADVTLLRFEVRRQAFNMSLAEIPLLLALFFLPPLTVLLVRVLSIAAVQARLRAGWIKASFNVAALAAGTACANVIAHPQAAPLKPGPAAWSLLAVAVLTNSLVTMGAVGGVITLVQGWAQSRQFLRSVVPVAVVACVNVTVGMVMLLALLQSPWAVLLLIGLAGVLGVVYRAYAQFLRQHKALTEMYELTEELTGAGADGALADMLLGRVRRLLQAESATLWLPAHGRHHEVLLSARVDYPGLLDNAASPDPLRQRAIETNSTVAVGPKQGCDELRAELRAQQVKDAIVVPLRSGIVVIGTLEVAGRLGDTTSFSAEDVRLLETVAAHAAVAVENSRLVDQLRFDAYHDALTGLPNRRRMLDAIEEAVGVHAPGEVVAVLLFDVAGLRDVNDSLGHGAGDEVLAEVAGRLRGFAPAAALVGRVGGGEFALTVRTASAQTAIALADEIRVELQSPMQVGALSVGVDCAVGIAVHPEHGGDAATLLQRADLATHAAKSGSTPVQLFNPGLESRSVRRLALAGDLRRALNGAELQVYFQPKVALRDRRVVGVECLARWEHPVYGPVPPEDFVAVAEHTGQLGRLTEVVLREALRRAREWADQDRCLPVSVNISPRTLLHPDFPDQLGGLLREYRVAADQLTLEITETGVVGEPDRTLPVLRRLCDLGVRLSVDDFGRAQSSLAYLRQLPVHEIKVDQLIVQGMATDPGDLAILKAILDLGRHFGLSVVAEGVESELTLGRLEEIGCDVGQGFLFSRPLPYDRLNTWLAAQSQASPAQSQASPAAAGPVRWLRALP